MENKFLIWKPGLRRSRCLRFKMAETKPRSGRVVKKPKIDDYIDVEDVVKLSSNEKKQRKNEENKLWSIEEIIDQKFDEVLVKWKNYEGEHSWISLTTNPELARYLEINEGNPDSSYVAKQDLPRGN